MAFFLADAICASHQQLDFAQLMLCGHERWHFEIRTLHLAHDVLFAIVAIFACSAKLLLQFSFALTNTQIIPRKSLPLPYSHQRNCISSKLVSTSGTQLPRNPA